MGIYAYHKFGELALLHTKYLKSHKISFPYHHLLLVWFGLIWLFPMAASEIEVVSSPEADTQQNQSDDQVPINDVFAASAYGDFEKVRKFIEDDRACVSRADANGYFALQWASLNNFADLAQYIIQVSRGFRIVVYSFSFVSCFHSIGMLFFSQYTCKL